MNLTDLELWRQADAILDELIDVSPDERHRRLAALPSALQARVTRLLDALDGDGPLDQPVYRASSIPARIGLWRIDGELGRGGMAVVYDASRELPAGHQHAALKLLTAGALAADGSRRFLREQQALMRLDHPHIATILDAGVLPDGTPWLAMERVDGERIDRYVRRLGLGPRRIVVLFRQVCDAVSWAHRQLVVHRDLKPSNILVDATGRARLLDFGIARLLDEQVEDGGTETVYRALTRQYAAPEQFVGRDSGTAADVFGLGAVLYQLLTGRPPRSPQDGAEAGITRPSRAATASEDLDTANRKHLGHALRGDLDAILLRALAAEPAQRYPDAASLADDLDRWLAQRPVRAARGNRLYRVRKFLVRHRSAVAATALLLTAIAVGMAGTLWQSQRAQAAAVRAEQETARALAARNFLLSLFESSNLQRPEGGVLDVPTLLAAGADRLLADPDLVPTSRIELLVEIGKAQNSHELYDAAADTLDRAIALANAEDAVFLTAEAMHERANVQSSRGDFAGARAIIDDALGRIEQLQHPKAHHLRARALVRRAAALAYLDEHDAAWRDLEAVEALLDGVDDPDPLVRGLLAATQGIVAYGQGRYADAYTYTKRDLELQRQLGGSDSPRVAQALSNLSSAAVMLGRLEEAARYDEEAVELARRRFPGGHPRIGHALYSLGDTQRLLGRYDASAATLREALTHFADDPDGHIGPMTRMALGRTLLAQGQWQAALDIVRAIQPGIDAGYGESSMAAIRLQSMRGEALQHLQPSAEREIWLVDSADRIAATDAAMRWHPIVQELRWRIAEVQFDLGRREPALRWLRETVDGEPDDNVSGAGRLRAEALLLTIAVDADASTACERAGSLRQRLDSASSASRETRAYVWAHLVRLAMRCDQADLRDAARQALAALRSQPLPQAELALANQVLAQR